MENRASVRTPDFSTTNPFTWWSTLVQSMSAARLPGSGDLQNYQDIQTSLLRSAGDQLGFINVNTVSSADPELERVTRLGFHGEFTDTAGQQFGGGQPAAHHRVAHIPGGR